MCCSKSKSGELTEKLNLYALGWDPFQVLDFSVTGLGIPLG